MNTLLSILKSLSIKVFIYGSLIIFASSYLSAQSVVISEEDANPAQSAILDVQSTDKGMLVPRMNRNQRDAIGSPAAGLLIYQTNDTPGFYYYTGSSWEALKSTGGGGITEEEDPQVGNIANNRIPKWDGEKLVSSSITETNERFNFGNSAFISQNGRIRITDNIKIYSEDGGDLNDNNGDKARMEVANGGYAYFVLRGDNDRRYVRIGSTFDAYEPDTYGVNRGAVYIFNGEIDTSNPPAAGMEVMASGQSRIYANRIEADSKAFVVDHPEDDTKQIAYISLEGPEAGMYSRGTAKLVDGKATIELPEHFRLMAVESSMTVVLTPLSGQSMGLAVTKKSVEAGILVEELMNGKGNYQFDWEVKSIRKGFENHQVVRPKQLNQTSDLH
ncbi:MAG: hypothetical protein ACFB15_06605 [Cyclobacteriaceae bacterium]